MPNFRRIKLKLTLLWFFPALLQNALITKIGMLTAYRCQELLKLETVVSTSCGRFQRFGYKYCERCVPSQVRRAFFKRSGGGYTQRYTVCLHNLSSSMGNLRMLGLSAWPLACSRGTRALLTPILQARR